MPAVKKLRISEELSEKLSSVSVAIATDFSGTPSHSMMELRRHLRSHGIEYKVVKDRLAALAADSAGKPEVKEILDGPTGLALGFGDAIEPIKVLTEYVRSHRLPIVVRAAALDGRVFRGAQLTLLTQLPTRETLVAQLVGQLASPITRLATVLNQPMAGMVNVLSGPMRGLASVLQQRVAQQGGA